MVVNAPMNSAPRAGAALTALFGLGLLAQDPVGGSPSVEARLAAAAMAEGRGDFAAAEKELRLAVGMSGPREKARSDAALKAFLQRAGRSEGEETPQQGEARTSELLSEKGFGSAQDGQDPVRVLVRRLDLGGRENADVDQATKQLLELGPLVVGPVTEAMPQFGPFGLVNALALLRRYDDPRIATTVVKVLERGDAGIAALVAQQLDGLQDAVAMSIATRLAASDQPPAVRAAAIAAVSQKGSVPDAFLAAVKELVRDPVAHRALLEIARAADGPWVVEFAKALAASDDPWLRGDGLLLRCRLEPGIAESDVLAVLETLSTDAKAHVADRLVPQHPEWVHVAAMGLAANNASAQSQYLKVQWWQMPDFSAKALLAHHNRSSKHPGQFEAPLSSQQIEQIVRTCIEAGWRANEDTENELADYCVRQNRWNLLVEALSDEERAIVWRERLGAPGRAIAFAAASSPRRWHRLVVEELAASTDPDADAPRLIANRDWTGLDEATKQKLVDVVARWTKELPVPRRGAPYQSAVAVPRLPAGQNWTSALLGDQPHARLVPVEVVLLLSRAGHAPAFEALVKYDKALFFRECETMLDEENSRWIADFVVDSGTVEQRPLLLRCLAFSRGQFWRGVDTESRVLLCLRTWSDGSLDVVALGSPGASGDLVTTATVEASKASVDDLARILTLMPGVHEKVASAARRALQPQLRAAHGDTLHAALAGMLAADAARSSESAAEATKVFLVDSLVAIDRTDSKDLFDRILDGTRGDMPSRAAAAKGLLAFAGERRGEVLRRLLRDDAPDVVAVAFAAPEQRTDPALRDATFATLLRLGPVVGELASVWFEAMNPKDATAIATALLEHEGFPKFTRPVVESALRALSASKDGKHVTILARAVSHPDVDVRVVVATNLGRTFDRAAVPHLVQLLKDDHHEVVNSANTALQRLSEFFEAEKKWADQLK